MTDKYDLVNPSEFVIGHYYELDGKIVRLMSGEYLDSIYQRLSNHWTWRVVNKDGTLSDEVISGYGDRMKRVHVKESISIEVVEPELDKIHEIPKHQPVPEPDPLKFKSLLAMPYNIRVEKGLAVYGCGIPTKIGEVIHSELSSKEGFVEVTMEIHDPVVADLIKAQMVGSVSIEDGKLYIKELDIADPLKLDTIEGQWDVTKIQDACLECNTILKDSPDGPWCPKCDPDAPRKFHVEESGSP